MNLALTILPAFLAAALSAGGVFFYLLRRERLWQARYDGLSARINEINLDMIKQAAGAMQLFQQTDTKADNIARELQSDMKLLEMQMRAPPAREVPDTLDLAIRLAKDGESANEISRKTSLSEDIAGSIIAIHGGAPKR